MLTTLHNYAIQLYISRPGESGMNFTTFIKYCVMSCCVASQSVHVKGCPRSCKWLRLVPVTRRVAAVDVTTSVTPSRPTPSNSSLLQLARALELGSNYNTQLNYSAQVITLVGRPAVSGADELIMTCTVSTLDSFNGLIRVITIQMQLVNCLHAIYHVTAVE